MNRRKPKQPRFERQAHHGLDEFNAREKRWAPHRVPSEHAPAQPATLPARVKRRE